MDPRFRVLVDTLEPKFLELVTMPPVTYGNLPRHLPDRAIYLFSEFGRHLYVGRTNNLRRRLGGHCRPKANHFTATFAFRIAREVTGMTKATYKREGSRALLAVDPVFGPAFEQARQRIARMELRYVEESNAVKQALLEIYAATVLETPYNDFENH